MSASGDPQRDPKGPDVDVDATAQRAATAVAGPATARPENAGTVLLGLPSPAIK